MQELKMITVALVGPKGTRSQVTISNDATVRDAATARYGLFWRTLKRNGDRVPFTQKIKHGDIVSVEEQPLEFEP